MHRSGAVPEQRDRLYLAEGVQVADSRRIGYRKRRHLNLLFTLGAQRLAASDQNLDARARGQQLLDERGGAEDNLKVVEHQQHLAVLKHSLQRVPDWHLAPPRVRRAEHVGDGCRYIFRVPRRAQVDEIHALVERTEQLSGRLDAQACLARARRPDKAQQPDARAAELQARRDVRELTSAPHERTHRRG
jgi:hypothetical protein